MRAKCFRLPQLTTFWSSSTSASERSRSGLLLVVRRHARDLLAGRISGDCGNRATLAISRDGDAARDDRLAVVLDGKVQCAIVDFRVGPRIGSRVASDGIVFAVVLAGPLVMRRLAIAADPV